MPRYFTHGQAEALLPTVEPLLRNALLSKKEMEEAEAELLEASRRIAMLGGSTINRERLSGERNRREREPWRS